MSICDVFLYYEEARELGYSLHHCGNDGSGGVSYVSYVKNGLFLDIWRNEAGGLLAKLSFVFPPAITSIRFSLPNKNFAVFEDRMMRAKRIVEAEGL